MNEVAFLRILSGVPCAALLHSYLCTVRVVSLCFFTQSGAAVLLSFTSSRLMFSIVTLVLFTKMPGFRRKNTRYMKKGVHDKPQS